MIESLICAARKLSAGQTMRTLAQHGLSLSNVLVGPIGSTKSASLANVI